MPLYLNELAPWERKSEYYHTIQLGKDVKEQTQTINNQTKAMIASQIASTNAVIASQERISEGIDTVACGIGRVEQGIYELQAAFEWGISEVVWQIEQNRAVLKDILEVLMAPLDTQAKERRKRAEDAYANGWIEDAEGEFIESERLNKFDFSIHISLGMIYLFHKVDKKRALSYFEKAVKYSKPKSIFHASYALLHKALIIFDLGETEEAEKFSAEAVNLSPNFTEALYQNAQYNAQLKTIDKSISNLEKAIRADKLYCLKANNDPMFDPIRNYVNKLFERMRDEVLNKCEVLINSLKPDIGRINKWLSLTKEFYPLRLRINDLSSELMNIEKIVNRKSYYDGIDAQSKLVHLSSKIEEYKKNIYRVRSRVRRVRGQACKVANLNKLEGMIVPWHANHAYITLAPLQRYLARQRPAGHLLFDDGRIIMGLDTINGSFALANVTNTKSVVEEAMK